MPRGKAATIENYKGNSNAVKPPGEALVISVSFSREDTAYLKDGWQSDSSRPENESLKNWTKHHAKRGALGGAGLSIIVDEIQKFAREYSDKGELTQEETGYAKAMLMVARTLPVEYDDMTDALLDNIEFNKL